MNAKIILSESEVKNSKGELQGIMRIEVEKAAIDAELLKMGKEDISKEEKKSVLNGWGFKENDIDKLDAEGWL